MMMEGDTARGLGGIGRQTMLALAALLLPLLQARADGGKGEKDGKGEEGLKVIILRSDEAGREQGGHEKAGREKVDGKRSGEIGKQLDAIIRQLSERGVPAADLDRVRADLNAALERAAAAEKARLTEAKAKEAAAARMREPAEAKAKAMAMEAAEQHAAAELKAAQDTLTDQLSHLHGRVVAFGGNAATAPVVNAPGAPAVHAIRDEIELLEARLQARRAEAHEIEVRIRQATHRLQAAETPRVGAAWAPGTALNAEGRFSAVAPAAKPGAPVANPEVRVWTVPGGKPGAPAAAPEIRILTEKPGAPLVFALPGGINRSEPAVNPYTATPAQTADSREKRLADLEKRLEGLLKEVKGLRGEKPGASKAPANPAIPAP